MTKSELEKRVFELELEKELVLKYVQGNVVFCQNVIDREKRFSPYGNGCLDEAVATCASIENIYEVNQ